MKTLVSYLKIIGIVVGISTGVMTGVGVFWKVGSWFIETPRASEVRDNREHIVKAEARIDVVEVRQENDAEWRRAIWEQMRAIADRVGARSVPPPVISTVQVGSKGDAPR
jgi:hypothetical protein